MPASSTVIADTPSRWVWWPCAKAVNGSSNHAARTSPTSIRANRLIESRAISKLRLLPVPNGRFDLNQRAPPCHPSEDGGAETSFSGFPAASTPSIVSHTAAPITITAAPA
jgi:hypothetical protein